MATVNRLWTETELQECVAAYAHLWREQQSGRETSKASTFNTLLKGALQGRTKGSVEYRMGNISAVMESAGKPFLIGYVPARNVGPTNTKVINRMLRVEGLI